MRKTREVFSIYFVPEDGDLTLILGGGAPVILTWY